jgi:hypothetical protein
MVLEQLGRDFQRIQAAEAREPGSGLATSITLRPAGSRLQQQPQTKGARLSHKRAAEQEPLDDGEAFTDLFGGGGLRSAAAPARSAAAIEALLPELEVNHQVLCAVSDALEAADPQAHLSPERIDSLCALVAATFAAQRGTTDAASASAPAAAAASAASDDGSQDKLVSVIVRGVLEKYAGELVSDCGRSLVSDLESVLYDEMVFERVVAQVDKTYAEEISELRKTQSELKQEETQLMRQRAEDVRKLQDERVQRYSVILRGGDGGEEQQAGGGWGEGCEEPCFFSTHFPRLCSPQTTSPPSLCWKATLKVRMRRMRMATRQMQRRRTTTTLATIR